jgi:hypothetical protein
MRCVIRVLFFPGSTRNPRKWVFYSPSILRQKVTDWNVDNKLYDVTSDMTTTWTSFLVNQNCFCLEAIFQNVLRCIGIVRLLNWIIKSMKAMCFGPSRIKDKRHIRQVSSANSVLCLHTVTCKKFEWLMKGTTFIIWIHISNLQWLLYSCIKTAWWWSLSERNM